MSDGDERRPTQLASDAQAALHEFVLRELRAAVARGADPSALRASAARLLLDAAGSSGSDAADPRLLDRAYDVEDHRDQPLDPLRRQND